MSEDEVARRHIAALEHEGVSEAEVGAWTLDEEAARRKLAEYRLVDAARWLCMIVEVATLLGASTIELEPSFDELRIEFDGEALALDAFFARVWGGRSGSRRERAARKLAIAIEALLEDEDAQVVIESAGGRLSLRKRERAFEATPATSPRTCLVVRRRAVSGWPELERVRVLARYARASIAIITPASSSPVLETITQGLEQALVEREASYQRWPIHEGEATIGWLGHGVPSSQAASTLIIVSDGVIAEQLPLGGKGEVVIVEASLDKDLAENHVLRNAAFDRLLALAHAARAAHPFHPVMAGSPRPIAAGQATWGQGMAPWLGGLAVFFTALIAWIVITLEPEPREPEPLVDKQRIAIELEQQLAASTIAMACATDAPRASPLRTLELAATMPGTQGRIADLRLERYNGLRRTALDPAFVQCIERKAGAVLDRVELDAEQRERLLASPSESLPVVLIR